MSFLNQLISSKDEDDEDMEVDEPTRERTMKNKEGPGFVFRKKNKSKTPEELDKPFFRNSNLVMPECTVGEKPKKKEKKKQELKVEEDKKFVKLGHLDEEED